jgi:rod shape-determining protein MreC
MPVRNRPSDWTSVTALSWRTLAQRFSYILFMALAFGLLVLGRTQPIAIEGVRSHVVDGLAPVFDAISQPVTATQNAIASMKSYLALREENAKLRAETAQIRQWQDAVVTLQNENKELHSLLNFKTEPSLAYISARVIADAGGPFVRSMIVTAGKVDGVREGMAVMAGDGLIGRVIEAGDWSSRILLATDLSSRIPVMIEGAGDRAILAGDNSPTPKLLYLPEDTGVRAGARVVTSGHGGVFPPNLPVGVVTEISKGVYGVIPAADLGRINYVRMVDFSLKGGVFNPLSTAFDPKSKK